MSTSPSIIFNCNYCTANDTSERNDFYRCKNASFNIVTYVDRDSAADKLPDEEAKKVKAAIEHTELTGTSILGYGDKRKGSTGLFFKDEKNADKGKQKAIKDLQETGSNVWHSVLSFTPEISNLFCTNKAEANKLLQKTLPDLFKNSGLDYNNINWCAAYHTNTDHRHIHLVFWEKEATHISSKGEKSFTKKGNIPQSCFANFKASILKNYSESGLEYFSMRDEIRQGITSTMKNNRSLFESFVSRSASIIEGGHYQYGRLNDEQKKTVDAFAKLALEKDPALAKKYNEYLKNLKHSQALYIKAYTDNNVKKIPKNVTSFYSSRKKELDARLGNAVLKQLKEYVFQREKEQRSLGYKNGAWQPSKLSPKNRKAILTSKMGRVADSALKMFFAEMTPDLDRRTMTDEEFRNKLKREGKVVIYEQ